MTVAVDAEPVAEARPLAIAGKLLPELAMTIAAVAWQVWPETVGRQVAEGLTFVALTEVFFAMAQGTLTDVATRLRRRPPWWLVVLIAGGLGLMYPDTVMMLRGAFREGWMVFLPFGWSVLERLRELWTMPDAPRLEKLRRRALVSGRISIVLVVPGAALAVAGLTYALGREPGGFDLLGRTAGWWLAAAFGLATADIVRVHRPSFARRPRALIPGLDPLHVDYLAPL
jgi:hypothetical protein